MGGGIVFSFWGGVKSRGGGWGVKSVQFFGWCKWGGGGGSIVCSIFGVV